MKMVMNSYKAPGANFQNTNHTQFDREIMTDHIANQIYDFYVKSIPLMYKWLSEHALKYCNGSTVLDLGTGTGMVAIEFATGGKHVIALDHSLDMLRCAEQNISSRNLDIALVRGNAEKLPFRDRSFDMVVSNWTLHHFNQPLAVLKDIERALKHGGGAFLTDCAAPPLQSHLMASWWIRQLTQFRVIREFLGSYLSFYSFNEAKMLAASTGSNWKVKPMLFGTWFALCLKKEQVSKGAFELE